MWTRLGDLLLTNRIKRGSKSSKTLWPLLSPSLRTAHSGGKPAATPSCLVTLMVWN